MSYRRGHGAPLGSAPRASSPPADAQAALQAPTEAVDALVAELNKTFLESVRRSMDVKLDGSVTSLAFVDHYLSTARDEDREPIVSLLAAQAGAYFGELVRRELGGTWIGQGDDPRRLRLLLAPAFLHFCPIDQALEAIAGQALDPGDARVATGHLHDPVFHLASERGEDDEPANDDAGWLHDRLAELPPIPEDQFHSLTGRFETLQLMLELLAAKWESEGRSPRQYGISDYLKVLIPSA